MCSLSHRARLSLRRLRSLPVLLGGLRSLVRFPLVLLFQSVLLCPPVLLSPPVLLFPSQRLISLRARTCPPSAAMDVAGELGLSFTHILGPLALSQQRELERVRIVCALKVLPIGVGIQRALQILLTLTLTLTLTLIARRRRRRRRVPARWRQRRLCSPPGKAHARLGGKPWRRSPPPRPPAGL
jgi:hypothetical protein